MKLTIDTGHNCSSLPTSVSGKMQPAGCAGAVWSNGKGSSRYCTNSTKDGRWAWCVCARTHARIRCRHQRVYVCRWAACCSWDSQSSTCKANDKPPATVAPRMRVLLGPGVLGSANAAQAIAQRLKPRYHISPKYDGLIALLTQNSATHFSFQTALRKMLGYN